MNRHLGRWFLGVWCALAAVAAGEEIVLRDGKKLTGTITGLEKGVYRLETEFGVALIKKEWIVRIDFSPAAGKETGAAKAAAEAVPSPLRTPPPPRPATIRERRLPGTRMEERVEGNTYVNESFRFELFKPPTWRVLDERASSIPSAVTALGTPDESTVLVVGSVLYEAPPSAYASVLDSALRQNYAEFAAGPEEQIQVAGRPAIRRSFRGVAGGHEWHGLVVNLANGAEHYGIIGITRDEAFQFKQGVLSKVMNSFRFR